MAAQFEYTTLANRFTSKFPLLSYVGIQINFWVLANLLLVTVIILHSRILSQWYAIRLDEGMRAMTLGAVVFGILYGVCFGISGYYLDRGVFRRVTLGKVILLKAIGSLLLLFAVLWLLRFVLYDRWVAPLLEEQRFFLNDESWGYVFYLLLTYYFFMTLMISFINQVNKKYGPGVLLPLLLGRYRNPKEEERIFMFMDLKSSTTLAEELGHLKYSAFIRDCFADINEVLFPFCAQIYQYVGDEVVVTWPIKEGLEKHRCIQFYCACKDLLQSKKAYYSSTYGVLPYFKAGVHVGKVVTVEIGEIKKDIAYHGDVLNTASRIQGVCNELQKDLLISEVLLEKLKPNHLMDVEFLNKIMLRGKSEKVDLVSISRKV